MYLKKKMLHFFEILNFYIFGPPYLSPKKFKLVTFWPKKSIYFAHFYYLFFYILSMSFFRVIQGHFLSVMFYFFVKVTNLTSILSFFHNHIQIENVLYSLRVTQAK